jgi:hypothetical protein
METAGVGSADCAPELLEGVGWKHGWRLHLTGHQQDPNRIIPSLEGNGTAFEADS